MSPRIVLTGGGTAGHVTPNLALLPGLRERGFEILYIGSLEGIEKGLMEQAGVEYRGIPTGKFRRYSGVATIRKAGNIFQGFYEAAKERREVDRLNRKDLKNVVEGREEALRLIRDFAPDVVFSKGGYVSVPVVSAAHKLGIPAIIHESDMTPGLANRLVFRYAEKICCNFPETLSFLPKEKGVLSGSPIRDELRAGSREKGLEFAGFDGKKPVLLMIGGSMGARKLNDALRKALDSLLPDFDVIHLCGKGNLDETLSGRAGYVQYEYISEELKDLFAAADIVFSRAGANAICELLALKKPNLLVPLSKAASRGDQILNARSFEKQGFSMVIEEEHLTPDILSDALHKLFATRAQYVSAMEESAQQNGVDVILGLIDGLTQHRETSADGE
ncbi:MAG: glycosyltransferase [Lachnospiraceae bacterium]|nr:glycosyltransferase [Lachnospiraceae bacterium]